MSGIKDKFEGARYWVIIKDKDKDPDNCTLLPFGTRLQYIEVLRKRGYEVFSIDREEYANKSDL